MSLERFANVFDSAFSISKIWQSSDFFLGALLTTLVRLTIFNLRHKATVSRIIRIVHVSSLQPVKTSAL